jgi:hypothetical protein
MKKLALIGMLCAGCGSEPFSEALFDPGERDAGSVVVPEAGVVVPETGPVVPETGPVVPETGAEVSPPCNGRYLSLPGSPAELLCPNLVPPFTVAGAFRLGPEDPEVRIARDGPEVPCGWSLSVRGGTVKATVTALFDHFAQVQIAGSGWRRVSWHYDGELSTILVDDVPVAVTEKPSGSWAFPSCSKPARVEGSGDVDDVSIQNQTWRFDDESACE